MRLWRAGCVVGDPFGSHPIPEVRLVHGLVVTAGSELAVNVNGATPPVWWPAGYVPTAGDTVLVLIVDGRAAVQGPVIAGQRPLTGTVSGSPSSGKVPVDTSSGTLSCRYVGTAPGIGELVRLDWQSTTPWVWPSAAASVPDQGPEDDPDDDAPSAPTTPQTGTLTVPAIASGTWNQAFSSWSSFHRTNLVQGTYAGQSYAGSWFYGSGPAQLAGRTVTGFRVRLGARLRIGNYNSSLTLNLYRHTSRTRPSGDVSRVAGPDTVSLPSGASARWVTLPTAWGQAIVDSGGGLGISGGSYGGVAGIGSNPASGQLSFDWSR